jgi:hypothetical protein
MLPCATKETKGEDRFTSEEEFLPPECKADDSASSCDLRPDEVQDNGAAKGTFTSPLTIALEPTAETPAADSIFDLHTIDRTRPPLGAGGFGEVHAAVNKKTGERVAAKVLARLEPCRRRPAAAAAAAADVQGAAWQVLDMVRNKKDKVQRECDVMAKLHHPHIIDIYGHGTGQNVLEYVVFMELASGGDLFDLLEQSAATGLSESAARVHFAQFLDALAYCHSLGIAHRDLKLENALFTTKDRTTLKLIDFGTPRPAPRPLRPPRPSRPSRPSRPPTPPALPALLLPVPPTLPGPFGSRFTPRSLPATRPRCASAATARPGLTVHVCLRRALARGAPICVRRPCARVPARPRWLPRPLGALP